MPNAEFDEFADDYRDMHQKNVAITGEEPEFFASYKVIALKQIAAARGVTVDRILDFGSGVGNSIPEFTRTFVGSELTCADVSERSLAAAESSYPGQMRSLPIRDGRLASADRSFDLCFSACVFHHIPHEDHAESLQELHRVTRPGGMLAIFEHNPLNPLTVRAVNTCPFDVNAKLIRAGELARRCLSAGWTQPQIRFHLFFPRALAALRPIERHLTWLPLGAQYSVTAQRAG